jgi:ubiquinone/menaquinone biosynthesis C-methylase UbiE
MTLDIKTVLICPLCRSELVFPDALPEKGHIVCARCQRQYPVEAGIIDLRTGVTQKGEWDLHDFEQAYQKMGYYQDNLNWADSGGYPRFVEEYRYPRVKGRIIEWLQPQDGAIILDVGCGVGYLFFDIIKNYPAIKLNLVGLDPSHSNIYWLHYRKNETHQPDIIGFLGEAEALPFHDQAFDAVVTSEAIEHIYDKAEAIRQMYRVLKPGGRLFITTPTRSMVIFWKSFFWLPQQIRRIFKSRKKPTQGKAAYDEPLTKKQLKRLLMDTGFRIKHFEQNAIMPHESYFQFFPLWLSRIIINTGCFMENYLKFLFAWAGLHYVVEAEK